jgi:hypothetical protein
LNPLTLKFVAYIDRTKSTTQLEQRPDDFPLSSTLPTRSPLTRRMRRRVYLILVPHSVVVVSLTSPPLEQTLTLGTSLHHRNVIPRSYPLLPPEQRGWDPSFLEGDGQDGANGVCKVEPEKADFLSSSERKDISMSAVFSLPFVVNRPALFWLHSRSRELRVKSPDSFIPDEVLVFDGSDLSKKKSLCASHARLFAVGVEYFFLPPRLCTPSDPYYLSLI